MDGGMVEPARPKVGREVDVSLESQGHPAATSLLAQAYKAS
jgi:hypothetical protein